MLWQSLQNTTFLAFSDLTFHLFSGCTVSPDGKKTKIGSSNKEASLSGGKNTGVVSVSCHAWKYVHTAISHGVDISKVPGCHFLQQMSYQWG